MSKPSPAPKSIDVDLVAAQFETLSSDEHRAALLEAIRSRDVYRRLTEELREKVAKLEQGLLGPKSERFKGTDDAQLSLQVLAELLGRANAEGAEAAELEAALLEQAEAEAEAEAVAAAASDGGGSDGEDGDDGQVHRQKRKRLADARPRARSSTA